MRLYNPYENIDPKFDMSAIRIIYTPMDSERMPRATVSFASLQAHLPPEETRDRDIAWQKALDKEPLENEPMVSVRFVDRETGDLKVAPAEYRDWKTMAKKGFYASYGDMYIPNSLNVQMLVQTNDNYLVLGDRPPKEDGKQPAFQIPGGMLNPNDRRGDFIAPDIAAKRELAEEVGPVPVQNVRFLGTSFYAGRVITTLYYTAELAMSAEELTYWRQSHRDEIKDFKAFPKEHYVPLTSEGIQEARDSGRLRETAEVGLILKGKQALGNEWFLKHCPQKMR